MESGDIFDDETMERVIRQVREEHMDKKKKELARLLQDEGLYVNMYEGLRLDTLWDMCRSAWLYRTCLDLGNGRKAGRITFDDLADAFEKADTMFEEKVA